MGVRIGVDKPMNFETVLSPELVTQTQPAASTATPTGVFNDP